MDFIAQDRPQTAAVWLEKLLERVGQLEQFEQQGRVVREIGLPASREVLHAPYRITYRIDAARAVILTLQHVRRAWDPAEIDDTQRIAAADSDGAVRRVTAALARFRSRLFVGSRCSRALRKAALPRYGKNPTKLPVPFSCSASSTAGHLEEAI